MREVGRAVEPIPDQNVSPPPLPHGGKIERPKKMLQEIATEMSSGYTIKAVCARITDMDVSAIGNAERAAWKRYMSYALLAIARGIDKKALVDAIFGKGAKPSKTFQNMYSMADKARNTVLGNHSWDDVRALPIDQATTIVLGMINRHMTTLSCSSKNDYDRFCNLSPAEADAKRKAETELASDPVASPLPLKVKSTRSLTEMITEMIVRSVSNEARLVFAENLLAEMANVAAAQQNVQDPWLTAA
jgi:hypothetical protein